MIGSKLKDHLQDALESLKCAEHILEIQTHELLKKRAGFITSGTNLVHIRASISSLELAIRAL